MKLKLSSLLLLSLTMAPAATLFVDFTNTGGQFTVLLGEGGAAATTPGTTVTFSSQDTTGSGVSFDVTATAVTPAGGGAFGGGITQTNAGLGSTVENNGNFLNDVNGLPEVLQFTISNIVGLQAGETLQLLSLLSQNPNNDSGNQAGGFGGTFGNAGIDSVTLTSDIGTAVVVNQSDAGNLGGIFLNADNGGGETGNTFSHGDGDLGFDLINGSSFTIGLNTTNNQGVVIQGFEFEVIPVPEPSTSLLALGGFGLLFIRKRRG